MNIAPAPIEPELCSDFAKALAALGHPVRLQILRHLACQEGRCCKDVVGALPLAQSTVSQHLKVLVESGLVSMSVEGKKSRYTINADALSGLSSRFGDLIECCTRDAGCSGATTES